MKVNLTFVFDTERDKDILRRLRAEPNRSAAAREALRAYYEINLTLRDIYDLLVDIKRTGAIVTDNRARNSSEPSDIADALDSLGT